MNIRKHATKAFINKEIFLLVKYRFNGDGDTFHYVEGIDESTIGIPDKRFAKGRKILNGVRSGDVVYAIIYDCDQKKFVASFVSNGKPAYRSDTEIWSNDARAPGEVWGLRVKGYSTGMNSVGVTLADFLQQFPEYNIVKGSIQGLTREQYKWLSKKLLG